ncbi:hypothetical protein GGS20DRAFT_562664 [Poronia punctata]|nr:hypothetical protein GGS20DRAFT_562664 [Poronia punctata]
MDSSILKRIWKEIREVNDDFFNLRTVIAPAPNDDLSQFYFAMCPNDGAMAHMIVVGCLYIPETYPVYPPVVHVYTKTGRYNVDVYSGYVNDRGHSTLCFDILRSQSNGGTWKPDYTLASLLASLMSAIVSFYVPQEHGGAIPEYVSMEKLASVKRYATEAYRKHKHLIPQVPAIPLVEAKPVPANQLAFPSTITVEKSDVKVTAGPIYLQEAEGAEPQTYTFAVDLSQLTSGYVFSVVLSNSETDILGKKSDTILVRNGVTATAARKRAKEVTQWFYHGKPMNDGDMRLHVTIGRGQMTMAYYEGGRRYVHGDCPVSLLSPAHIGHVRGMPFYVHIYLKRKFGLPVTVTILDTKETGYIHAGADRGGGEDDFEYISHLETNETIDGELEEWERVTANDANDRGAEKTEEERRRSLMDAAIIKFRERERVAANGRDDTQQRKPEKERRRSRNTKLEELNRKLSAITLGND